MNHEEEINTLHRRQSRTKLVVLLVIGFMALLTYLLISVSQQIAQSESMDFRSRASETYMSSQTGSDGNSGSDISLQDPSTETPRACGQITVFFPVYNVVGSEIVGCRSSARCDNGKSHSITCAYNPQSPLERNKNNFNRDRCDRAGCEAQMKSLCACSVPTAVPPLLPTSTPYLSPTPKACTYTAEYGDNPFGFGVICKYSCSNGKSGEIHSSRNQSQEWCNVGASKACGCDVMGAP